MSHDLTICLPLLAAHQSSATRLSNLDNSMINIQIEPKQMRLEGEVIEFYRLKARQTDQAVSHHRRETDRSSD